jgi:hypothetical protein
LRNTSDLLKYCRMPDHLKTVIDLNEDELPFISYPAPQLLPDEIQVLGEPEPASFSGRPGRRLPAAGKTEYDWLVVDTWYVLGPLPSDRRRQSLDVRLGPETTIDLDDEFMGKASQRGKVQTVGWQYMNSGTFQDPKRPAAFWKIEPRHVDTYALYYAFTEIDSDVEQDAWIACGVDDYGKLWLNDTLIWKSPKQRRPYSAVENVRKVHLKRGHNKVLMRVENAGGSMGFSLMIRLRVE